MGFDKSERVHPVTARHMMLSNCEKFLTEVSFIEQVILKVKLSCSSRRPPGPCGLSTSSLVADPSSLRAT